MDPAAVAEQADLAFRLILAAVLGALIGLEREMHGHPAGMRTHLLVSVGAALFTVVSVVAFASDGRATDPTRIAAQVVSGIGFLGAGAIIKYGTSIKGLTTAGSLWATAAIGMAAGTGQVILAIAGWTIVLFSLWPLGWVVDRLPLQSGETMRLRLRLRGLEPLAAITGEFHRLRIQIAEVRSERAAKDTYDVEVAVLPPSGTTIDGLARHLRTLPDVESVDAVS